ncbi:MAG: hypothetical protein HKN47_15300 [Pirellulaceae bacterium]|nr:hypothetical protein [Pirellulaceae bacterium]
MNAEDFQSLYKLLRGSKSAFGVLDARTLFIEKKIRQALVRLQESRDSYQSSRARLMKQDAGKEVDPKAKDADRQIKRIERKQEKVREVLELFDELLPKLAKLAAREAARDSTEDTDASGLDADTEFREAVGAEDDEEYDVRPVTPADVSVEFAARFVELEGDEQLDWISRSFGFCPVESEDQIFPNAVYFIRIQDESFLVHTRGEEHLADGIPLVSVVDEVPMKTYSVEAFLRLGNRRRMVLLTTDAARIRQQAAQVLEYDSIDSVNATHEFDVANADAHGDDQNEGESESAGGVKTQILDMGAFSQLMDSAQRSGLVPNADKIANLRDREFRLGRYDMAYSGIEGLFSSFVAAASQRAQKLAREDADIKGGRIKISPKELQAKRMRDRQAEQAVERARSRFQLVMNGLQVLMRTHEQDGS